MMNCMQLPLMSNVREVTWYPSSIGTGLTSIYENECFLAVKSYYVVPLCLKWLLI